MHTFANNSMSSYNQNITFNKRSKSATNLFEIDQFAFKNEMGYNYPTYDQEGDNILMI